MVDFRPLGHDELRRSAASLHQFAAPRVGAGCIRAFHIRRIPEPAGVLTPAVAVTLHHFQAARAFDRRTRTAIYSRRGLEIGVRYGATTGMAFSGDELCSGAIPASLAAGAHW